MQNRQKPFENNIQMKKIFIETNSPTEAQEHSFQLVKAVKVAIEEFGLTSGEDSLENDAHRCRSIRKKLSLARMSARF